MNQRDHPRELRSVSVFSIPATATPSERDSLKDLNRSIEAISHLRQRSIERTGPNAKSKLAWKASVFVNALCFRIAALADGAATGWNSGNALSAFLCSRAIIETSAVYLHFAAELSKYVESQDFQAIDLLTMRSLFSSRDQEIVAQRPSLQATSVLTFIDKLEKELPGVRGVYDRLSESCHPNTLGHRALFSNTDTDTVTVTFSDDPPAKQLIHIICAVSPIHFVVLKHDGLIAMIGNLAEIHHSTSPSPFAS